MRVVVVGSGIAGASAAYHASAAGAEVVLVDRPVIGEATAAGAGILCPWTSSRARDPDWLRIAVAGADYYPQLVEELASLAHRDVGYRRVGALVLTADHAERVGVLNGVQGHHAAGAATALDAGQARELFPPLRPDAEAVHIPGAARVDGRLLRDALRQGALRHGTRIVLGAARLAVTGQRVTGVTVDGQATPADLVIAAAGAWTPELLDGTGVRLDVRPQRGQLVHLELPGADTSRWPVVMAPGNHYLVAFDDSRVVAGATRETGSGFAHQTTAAGLATVLAAALAIAPGLAGARHLETRVGLRPMGPTALPVLGPAPGLDGLLLLTGLGPNGLTMGPYAGKLIADAALGNADTDLTPYNPMTITRGGEPP